MEALEKVREELEPKQEAFSKINLVTKEDKPHTKGKKKWQILKSTGQRREHISNKQIIIAALVISFLINAGLFLYTLPLKRQARATVALQAQIVKTRAANAKVLEDNVYLEGKYKKDVDKAVKKLKEATRSYEDAEEGLRKLTDKL